MAKTRSSSIRDILRWQFDEQQLPDAWANHLGNIDSRFLMYVDGHGGNGKTEYVMQFALMASRCLGKVRLNNVEQGKHSQIKKSIQRNDFAGQVPAGKFQYDNIRIFDDLKKKLARQNSGKIIIIDSISYWPLNEKQVQELFETFTNKSFVLVAYRAHLAKNQAIRHLCDIKINVEDYYANVESTRFGGTERYDIWPEKHAKVHTQPSLFDPVKS